MIQPVCPACGNNAFDKRDFFDVTEQNRLYAPDNQEIQRALNAAASEAALKYQMLHCHCCGLEFCEPLKAPSAAWYRLAYRALDLHSEDRWEFDEVLRRIPKDAHIFEFGCGAGRFLMHCRKRGVSASGMDFSEDGVTSCVAKGLAATRIDLYEIPASTNVNRVLQMAAFQFLEHLDRPMALFEHAAAKALPSAHLWVSVPSDKRPAPQFGFKEFLNEPPHHMTEWTPEAFRRIGGRLGWRLVEILYEPAGLRTSLWWIAVHSPTYLRWKAAGRIKNRFVHRVYCVLTLPVTLMRWRRKRRDLSGYAMLAHFVFDSSLLTRSNAAD